MTIREIFSGLIDYDLNPIFQFALGGLYYFVIPIGMFILGGGMLMNALNEVEPGDQNPAYKDLFGRVFLFLSGFAFIGAGIYIWWDFITLFF